MELFPGETEPAGRRQCVKIGLAMVFSVFIYAGIVELLARTRAPFTGYAPLRWHEFSILRLVLLGAALIVFAMIPILRRRILSTPSRNGTPSSPVERLKFSCIVSFALCESIAVCGLVLFLVSGARPEFHVFFSLSLLAFLVNFPRLEKWQEWMEMTADANRKEKE